MPENNAYIIETHNLNFCFNGKGMILKDINLKVERGSIYGFLGPNGAGKTTTIRILLGLLRDTKKSVRLFNKNLSENRIEVYSKTGALIEQPSLYEHISGYDNLEITRKIRNIKKERLVETLELVRLSSAAHKKVKEYSLGMKQRLGIANALIAEPELLILDEPVNGLDPNGMAEMRELLRRINRELNTTIFLSSHLLGEIEKIVTHVGIINMGEMLFQGTIEELINVETNSAEEVIIKMNNNKKAAQLLENFNVYECEDGLKIMIHSKQQVPQIIKALIENNIDVYEVINEGKNLKKLFLKMTENYIVS
ncbi:ABC transporter ATP-binding protein [Panacibacter ginsenosidivorans]|uniref:ABC transporter ATP-binding protein n=1 Tax=Panacibacter ginsenosidivorans TaxID=1813871 RepID=A0A5B8V4Q6_9BACT|nr:ABC transporter ATP-binding protein [Panacibacter ginsenosidivorans]QEC66374.1 ABC transporter ATP-binding protein [Panacibacter ginsenosidivorans]